MKKYLGYLKYLFFFFIGIGLLWLAFRNQDPEVLIHEFRNAEYIYVLWAVAAGLASTFSRAVRWNMLIKPFGYEISPFRSFLAVMTGYLANLAVPRMGEVTRCVVVNQTDKVPVNKLFGTVVTERVIDLIAIMLLMVGVLIFEWNRLTTFVASLDFTFNIPFAENLGMKSGLFLSVALLIVLFSGTLILYRLRNSKLLLKFRQLITGFVDGLVSIRKMKNKWAFILHTIFIWAMYILMTYFCFFAISSTSHLGLSAAFFVMAVGTFGFVAPVQGGIGAYHWLVQESLVLYDITRTDGLVFATIVHAAQTVYIMFFGILCLLVFMFYYRKKLSDVGSPLEEKNNDN